MLFNRCKVLLLGKLITMVAAAGPPSSPFILDFEVRRGDSENGMSVHNKPYLERREEDDGSVDMKLYNEQVMYMAKLKIGSNQDEVEVQVDTGSSDLYVITPDVDCYYSSYSSYSYRGKRSENVPVFSREYNSEKCTTYGSFDYTKSSSFKKIENVERFYIKYMDNTDSAGFYGSDSMQIGNEQLDTAIFAVANETSTNSGVFGIGFRQLESAYYYNYENIPLRLKSEGLIKKNAYSLYLNSENQTTGSVLFGAVDHAKYSGPLTTIPIVNSTDESSSLLSLLYGITFYPEGEGDDKKGFPITSNTYFTIFDSGTTLSILPANLIYRFAALLNGYYLNGYYVVPCPTSDDTYFTFDYGGSKIKVPLKDILIPSSSSSSYCYLGFQENQDDYILFGDNILRAMYIVYDLDGLTISVAQAKYTNDTQIEEIGADGGIPSATQAATYAAATYDITTNYESSVTATPSYKSGILTQDLTTSYRSSRSGSTYTYTGSYDPDYYFTYDDYTYSYSLYSFDSSSYDSYLLSLYKSYSLDDYYTTSLLVAGLNGFSSTSRPTSTSRGSGSGSGSGSSSGSSSGSNSDLSRGISMKYYLLIPFLAGYLFYL